jgi:hypothetical protein
MRNIQIGDDELGAAFDLPNNPVDSDIGEAKIARRQHKIRTGVVDYNSQRRCIADNGGRAARTR